jgi:hypothetical protein
MTEPSPSRPVPGPLRPSPSDAPAGENSFAELDEQPVAEHVAVFEAEHSRLQRELGTIDQL